MKNLKPHFLFDKHLRNGAFLLVLIIVFLQFVYTYFDFSVNQSENNNEEAFKQLNEKLDSLKNLKKAKPTHKIFPFNPNYISDHKGYQLGMSVLEIDRLHEFRKKNKFVNSKEDFQKVTKVSDSLLVVISPYFKFPDWVNKKKSNTIKTSIVVSSSNKRKKIIEIRDINKISESELIETLGMNQSLAARIIKYRRKLKGYTYKTQLNEVWGVNENDIDELLKYFQILSKPNIKKLNVNTASFKEVLKLPYIDYDLCKRIFDYKEEVAEIQDIEELKKITNFPLKKYDRIVLYLLAK
ncbi:DNA uptake protein ComE [Tenacibaculum sp. MAR_2009_124]|uniref:ComEA family DNA-binding protein n=1 Tax=Tenacibaculum sp. MAR_2009_124 TaxID=1250059 RepID=UPI0008958B86|nr:helix-hairpin-helix domain-containing protein [Tenacibaculum sp. MAR_2009_124]SEB73600.1 DNA uptake protein ComE [Tenacibaculum sp. MAR_2009_124]